MTVKKRIYSIDELRGLCIILMIIYHIFYSGAVIFGITELYNIYLFLKLWQPVLPFAFILISGISFQLSRSNVRRGVKLLIISIAITIVTAVIMPEQIIWFGIIHFLAFANIICGLLKKYIDKIPLVLGLIICAVLFIATYNLQRGYLGIDGILSFKLPDFMYKTDFTMMFGFYTPKFHSSDYNPIFPWIFLFTAGTLIGRYVSRLPESLCRMHIRPLAFIGRHTLIIYIAHQPIIIGIMYLITLAD